MGDTLFDSVVQLQNAPFSYFEIGAWYVPFTRLPQWMRDIVIASPRQFVETGEITGTGVEVASTPITGQGHLTPGLQSRLRGWAGEMGSSQVTQSSDSTYAPFTSHATWAIADDWYHIPDADWADPDLYQNEPIVSPYVRGALRSGFDVQTTTIDPDPSTSVLSLSQIVEDLFLLSRPEMTWAEYLAGHGVDPRFTDSMCMPLMLEHGYLGPQGRPQVFGGTTDTSLTDVENTSFSNTWQAEQHVVPTPDSSTTWDSRGIGTLGSKWSRTARPMIRFEQPGFVVGTCVWWSETGQADNYGHVFDANYMSLPGHWGNRSGTGIDEEDFIAAQTIGNPTGTGSQAGSDDEQDLGRSVINMLNLYLHGDIAAPLSQDFFRYRGPYGRILGSSLVRCSSRLSGQLQVISDLVG
jgi:hypothetical protein